MIADLSRTLQRILSQPELPAELAAAQISFDRPQESFRPEKDTVNLFLYDIAENVELRNFEPSVKRNGNRVLYRPAPMRVETRYLVTVWPVESKTAVLQEHRLLSQLLQVFAGFSVLPETVLQGRLAEQPYPVQLMLAGRAPVQDALLLWTALGLRPRPALTLTATLTLEPAEPKEGPVVMQANLQFGQRDASNLETFSPERIEESCWIAGRVLDGSKHAVPEAAVILLETGLRAGTDSNGQFVMRGLRPGRYTLQVTKGNKSQDASITVSGGKEKNSKGDFDVVLK